VVCHLKGRCVDTRGGSRGDWRKLRNELLDVYFSRDIICAVGQVGIGQMYNAFHWVKREGKRQLERPRRS
jgi:hypothetical protein